MSWRIQNESKLFASDEGLKLNGAKIIMYTVVQLEKNRVNNFLSIRSLYSEIPFLKMSMFSISKLSKDHH